MTYEVELKFPVADSQQLLDRLRALNAREIETVEQHDEYFRHPQRDFVKTDEALRIRRSGSTCRLTYKGPKVDTTTKTRQEIELPFGESPEAGEQMRELLEKLGFQSALTVSKRRRQFQVMWREQQVEATLDDVDQLGTFAELEIVAEEQDLDEARELVLSLADHCQLGQAELRGYADLLMEQSAARQ